MQFNDAATTKKRDQDDVTMPGSSVESLTLEEIPVEQAERLRLLLRQQGMMETGLNTHSLLQRVLLRPECVLAQQMNASLDDVYVLYSHVSAALLRRNNSFLSPTPVAAVLSSHHRHFISTGQECLDGALRGGLGCGLITEITGATGAGKTAFALNLAMRAASYPKKDDRRSCTLWITTDVSAFPATVAAAVLKRHFEARSCIDQEDGEDLEDALRNVAVTVHPTLAQLRQYFSVLRSHLANRTDVRFVVVDNFSVLVRRSFPGVDEEVTERHEAVAEFMSILKSIAQEFCVAIAVTTVSGEELGHSFLHAVNTRLRLTQCLLDCRGAFAFQEESQVRVTHVLELVKSSAAAAWRFECEFEGMCLKRARPLGDNEVVLVEDAKLFGADPFGHVTLPTFAFC
ncbi:putative DNA repair protein [Trypanosoma cruzi]|uniref:DNA repair protein n=1 Tax=Trypanosoma cruzi Dm28c TaxID=1416333 RepID=V5DSW2_TRYCR|nr:DNA repair protein [Trypanosoma cruzi Dm28c]KAF8281291.1 putative DNA repair protein [Trypanosoma cruzi]RNF20788.1 putative DNA repair protein [Trypanosoma cruzi]